MVNMFDATLNLKICGITDPATARCCADSGAGAVGVVFYENSPRNVSVARARYIFGHLPDHVARVGVFVDMSAEDMVRIARDVPLDTVQMHGSETAGVIEAVMRAGLHVVKVLKTSGEKLVEEARGIPHAAGILVECGKGMLPGGNGAAWDWKGAAVLAGMRRFAVAGGLTPGNIRAAALSSLADAWDVSSGVESAPGRKDLAAVTALLDVVKRLAPCERLFWKEV